MSDPTPSGPVVDWTDPCARARALRNAYFTLVTGGQEAEVRTRSLDADEMVRFQPADPASLRSDLAAAEAECAAKTAAATGPALPKRFAIACRAKHHYPSRYPGYRGS